MSRKPGRMGNNKVSLIFLYFLCFYFTKTKACLALNPALAKASYRRDHYNTFLTPQPFCIQCIVSKCKNKRESRTAISHTLLCEKNRKTSCSYTCSYTKQAGHLALPLLPTWATCAPTKLQAWTSYSA